MAVSLLAHEVSDLCIGKPPLRPLPISATAGDALVALRACSESYLSVWATDGQKGQKKQQQECVGKVSAVDVICFLCDDEANLKDPRTALKSPVSALLLDPAKATGDAVSGPLVRRVEAQSSILEALDVILDGAQNLVVPIRPRAHHRRKLLHPSVVDFCCLTQEDLIRFFLNSIGLFSPIAALSVSELGLIRPDVLAVRHRDPALAAAPLLKRALASQTAVAVLTDDGKLIGEISPSTVALCPVEAAAAAVAALSAGELMAYLDCGCCPPDDAVRAVRARLLEKGLDGMVGLMDGDFSFCYDDDVVGEKLAGGLMSSSSSASSGSSSSSDEESSHSSSGSSSGKAGRSSRRRLYGRSGSYSSRMGRRSEEAIVCHPGSSLVAVMIQALAHRVSYVWVVEDDYQLAGVVTFPDILHVFREQIPPSFGASDL